MKLILSTVVFILLADFCFAQGGIQNEFGETKPLLQKLGLNIQAYPAGVISTITWETYHSEYSSFLFRVGINMADRKDFSPYNLNEKGNGFGGSFGYRRYRPLGVGNVFLGLNTDIWNMWIHWKDEDAADRPTSGITYTLVVQPWLEGGYQRAIGPTRFGYSVSLGFGREINAITKGDAVGQGWMASALIALQYNLSR